MQNRVRFLGTVPSKAVRGLPPGIKRQALTADKADATGRVWTKGTEYVAQAGGYSNPDRATYVDAVVL